MVDEREIGGGSAWAATVFPADADVDWGENWIKVTQGFEDYLTNLFFPDLGVIANHAVSQEAVRLNNLLQFEQNQDISDEDLTPCNRKGVRVMPSQQCAAPTAKGEQCGKRTSVGAYCWVHLKKILGLSIRKSHIQGAGKGLFAAKDFAAGEEVCRYTGDRIKGKTNPNFKGSMYVAQLDNRIFIDAARTNTAPGRMANAPSGHARANLKWAINQRHKTVRLVSTRPIKAGEELLIAYGGGYWSSFNKLQKQRGAPPKMLKAVLKKSAAKHPLALKQPAAEAASAAERRRKGLQAVSYGASVTPPQGKIAERDPLTFEEAMSGPERDHWLKAIAEEEASLNANKTFTPIFSLPSYVKLVGCKFVFKRKRDETGKIARYKVRLVAQGFAQVPGRDYDSTFSPVIALPSMRLLIAQAAALGHKLMQVDFKTAYLNAPLDKNVLMRVPKGMASFEGAVALQVEKGIYGLPQSGLLWFKALAEALLKQGFISHTHGEQCLFKRPLPSGNNILLGVYVDDIIISYHPNDKLVVEKCVEELNSQFKLTNLGVAKHILGIEIIYHSSGAITLSQRAYIQRICEARGLIAGKSRAELTPASTAKAPSAAALKKFAAAPRPAAATSAREAGEQVSEEEIEETRASGITKDNFLNVLGELMYLCNCTRPDGAQATNFLARDSSNPSPASLLGLSRLVRYFCGTSELGLTYSPQHKPLTLIGYCDATWADCSTSRRSTSGILLMLAGAAIHWRSKRQSIVATSSAEAEYIAQAEAAREIIYMRRLLDHIGIPASSPTILYSDSQAAIAIANNDQNNERRKHIDVKHHFIREAVVNKSIQLSWIATADQPADLFTKPLPSMAFLRHRNFILGSHFDSAKISSPIPQQHSSAGSSGR